MTELHPKPSKVIIIAIVEYYMNSKYSIFCFISFFGHHHLREYNYGKHSNDRMKYTQLYAYVHTTYT